MRVTTLSRLLATLIAVAPFAACSEDSPTSAPAVNSPGGITLIPRTATIRAGQVVLLQAFLVDEFGDPLGSSISWKSSNESVATVATTGEVFGRGEGLAVITASALGKGQVSTIHVLRRESKPDGKGSNEPLLLR